MILLGLNGKKGAGKDTAFAGIEKWSRARGVYAERQGFADKLKLSAARLFYPDCDLAFALQWADEIKQPREQLDMGNSMSMIVFGEKASVTGRVFLQRYGTEAHREVFDDDFWIDALLPMGYSTPVTPTWWSNFSEEAEIAVVTDVRFPNEAKRVKDLGGKIWKITRPTDDPGDGHASEQDLPDELIDQVIWNNSTIPVLHSGVSQVMDHYYGGIFR